MMKFLMEPEHQYSLGGVHKIRINLKQRWKEKRVVLG